MEKEGKVLRIKRGWYCVNPKYSKKPINTGVVANLLYESPSYVSLETAPSYYGLVPERAMGMTSVVTGRSRRFTTPIGWFALGTPLDLAHLVERAKESAPEVDVSTPEKVIAAFDARIDAIDFANAADDVRPYLQETRDLDIWSKEFFRQMIRKIIFA